MTNEPIHARLRRYIDSQGLSRKLIATSMRISEPKLSLMLNGKRRITVDEYFALCRAIALDPRKPCPWMDEGSEKE